MPPHRRIVTHQGVRIYSTWSAVVVDWEWYIVFVHGLIGLGSLPTVIAMEAVADLLPVLVGAGVLLLVMLGGRLGISYLAPRIHLRLHSDGSCAAAGLGGGMERLNQGGAGLKLHRIAVAPDATEPQWLEFRTYITRGVSPIVGGSSRPTYAIHGWQLASGDRTERELRKLLDWADQHGLLDIVDRVPDPV